MDRSTCERRFVLLRATYDSAGTTEARQEVASRIMKLLLDFMEQEDITEADREWASHSLAAFNEAQGRQVPPVSEPEPPTTSRRPRNGNGRSTRSPEPDDEWQSDRRHIRFHGHVDEQVPVEERRVHPDVWRWAITGAKLGIAVILLFLVVGMLSSSVWLWRGFWNSPAAITAPPNNHSVGAQQSPATPAGNINLPDQSASAAQLAMAQQMLETAKEMMAKAAAQKPQVIIREVAPKPPTSNVPAFTPSASAPFAFSPYDECRRYYASLHLDDEGTVCGQYKH